MSITGADRLIQVTEGWEGVLQVVSEAAGCGCLTRKGARGRGRVAGGGRAGGRRQREQRVSGSEVEGEMGERLEAVAMSVVTVMMWLWQCRAG